MNNKSPDLLLIDGTALAYQSFYALQDLRSPSGQPTGAVYGFHNTLQWLKKDYSPARMVVVMDRGAPVARQTLYADYKADRPPTPQDLLLQLPQIAEMVHLWGIPLVEQEGVEADDLLGGLAVNAAHDGKQVLIFSPDKDMLQLVSEQIQVLRRHAQHVKVYDLSAVEQKYGCRPDQFVDYLALMGDKVDGIPGVPGVGPKTASELLKAFGSLEEVLKRTGEIRKAKLRENLEQYADQARLSYQLAQLHLNSEIEPSQLQSGATDWEGLSNFYQKVGFSSALRDLERQSQGSWQQLFEQDDLSAQQRRKQYQTVTSKDQLTALAQQLQTAGCFALDTETTGLDTNTADLVGVCVGLDKQQGWYIPLGHRSGPNLSSQTFRDVFAPLLADPKIGKIGHNIKFDAAVLAHHHLPVQGWKGDTMVLAHLLHSQLPSLKLDVLSEQFLGHTPIPLTDLIGEKKSSQITMDQVSVDEAAEYGAEDAEITYALHRQLEKDLTVDLKQWYETVEIPLSQILLDMENWGIGIDTDVFAEQADAVAVQIKQAEQSIFELAGESFNPNSPQQLAHILFDVRKAPANRKRSTKQSVLEELANAGEPLAALIIEYRGLTKLFNTYLVAIPELVDMFDQRIHTSYHTTVTNTGRISSSNPNLQNIPIRTELGRRIRRGFVAQQGWQFVSADYSQIELRVLAHMSGDSGFIKAFRNGEDIHTRTAAEIFDVEPDQVDKDMRRKAKEINFGLNYGMREFGLAARLGISRFEARNYIQRYFARYPQVQTFFEGVLTKAEQTGQVTTVTGRPIEVPRPRSHTGSESRIAINAPIQGSAADILKMAMVELANQFKKRQFSAKMVLTVHDEIIVESPDSEINDVSHLLKETMIDVCQLDVPLEVDVKVGKSWADLG